MFVVDCWGRTPSTFYIDLQTPANLEQFKLRLAQITEMTAILGKRKRRNQLDDHTIERVNSTDQQSQALFRQHFEAQFRPLEGPPSIETKEPTPDLTKSEDSEDWEWTGLSDNDGGANIQVIEHTATTGAKRADVPRKELKTFMVIPSTFLRLQRI